MGCEIVVAGAERAAVAAVFEEWEDAFSLFRSESELSRVNRSDGAVIAVSPLFARTLAVALAVAAETDGLIDPTLCGRWREVRVAGGVVSRPAGLTLDLNGVVKSLAVDAAAELIDGEGFVSAGGDIAVRGPVDVALPRGGAIRVVEGGLATSGTASRGRHVIDPRTSRPSDSPWEQVTASGSSCLAADVAAKVAFLLGEDGPEWLDARGIPGRFLRPVPGTAPTGAHESMDELSQKCDQVPGTGLVVENAMWSGALACT
jgi:thiamine biosynthesis lipoprotein